MLEKILGFADFHNKEEKINNHRSYIFPRERNYHGDIQVPATINLTLLKVETN